MDRQDRQDFCVCIERLSTASTVLYRYNNPVYPVYPCLNPYSPSPLPRQLFRPQFPLAGDLLPDTNFLEGIVRQGNYRQAFAVEMVAPAGKGKIPVCKAAGPPHPGQVGRKPLNNPNPETGPDRQLKMGNRYAPRPYESDAPPTP